VAEMMPNRNKQIKNEAQIKINRRVAEQRTNKDKQTQKIT
jgi:hypothetical protein